MVRKKTCRIASIILILVLFISAAVSVHADKELVADQAGVFTADEAAKLRHELKALGDKYQMDIVIVTTADTKGKSSRDYADDYFDNNGYGVGENSDGILFLLDFDNREAYISTSGSGISYLTDERIQKILDEVFNNGLTEGDNFGAASAFLKSAGNFLAEGIPGDKNYVAEPADTVEASETVSNTLSTAETITGAIISGIIALFFYSYTKVKYSGVTESVEFDYRKNSFVNLKVIEDILVNTYITTRTIKKPDPPPKVSSDEITIHISSSGRSHGGGGRSFSGGSTRHTSSSGRSHGGGGRKF